MLSEFVYERQKWFNRNHNKHAGKREQKWVKFGQLKKMGQNMYCTQISKTCSSLFIKGFFVVVS